MSLTTSEMSPADIAAVTGNNKNNDGFGDNGAWWIIILFLFALCGWGGNGFGGFGNNGAGGALTRADLCQDMNFQSLENATRGIQQGICDSTYALNNSINTLGTNMMQGFSSAELSRCNQQAALMQQLNNMAMQNQQCCCETQRSIERGFCDTNYNLATQACDTRNTIQNTTRDIIENQNNGTRAILDFLTQDKISTLQSENQALRLAASQSNQNAALMAAMDANTAEIIRRTGSDCPIPAYVVPNPNCCYGNYGFNQNSGNCGCSGCGC